MRSLIEVIEVRVQAACGATAVGAIREAIMLALERNEMVTLTFNDVPVTIHPENVIGIYSDRLTELRTAKRTQNTEE